MVKEKMAVYLVKSEEHRDHISKWEKHLHRIRVADKWEMSKLEFRTLPTKDQYIENMVKENMVAYLVKSEEHHDRIQKRIEEGYEKHR